MVKILFKIVTSILSIILLIFAAHSILTFLVPALRARLSFGEVLGAFFESLWAGIKAIFGA